MQGVLANVPAPVAEAEPPGEQPRALPCLLPSAAATYRSRRHQQPVRPAGPSQRPDLAEHTRQATSGDRRRLSVRRPLPRHRPLTAPPASGSSRGQVPGLEHAPAGARIGLAGRSQEKLEKVRPSSAGRRPSGRWWWPTPDPDSPRLAEGRVVTTVGPYAQVGSRWKRGPRPRRHPLRDLAGRFHARLDRPLATPSRRRAAPGSCTRRGSTRSDPTSACSCCGEGGGRRGAGELETPLMVVAARGSISGGTIQSLLGELDAAKADRDKARLSADPYALSSRPELRADLGDERRPPHDEKRDRSSARGLRRS